jgi:CDK5 regulatory subunit-associated protein 3
MSLLFKSQNNIQRIVQSVKDCIQMSEYRPTRIVNLHYTNVMDWMLSSNLVNPKIVNPGTSPQDVIDIDIQFAKLYFTENKVASVPKEISNLIAGSITYIDAKKIYSFLEQTEGRGSAKNIFGLYNSEALKSWWTLLVSWVTNNLHIAHAVNTLVKRLGIDEPNLQRKYQATEKIFRTIDNRFDNRQSVI